MWLVVHLTCDKSRVRAPVLHKLGVVRYTCSLRNWEVEAGGSESPGYPLLYNEFEANLGFMSLRLSKKKKKRLLSHTSSPGPQRFKNRAPPRYIFCFFLSLVLWLQPANVYTQRRKPQRIPWGLERWLSP